MPIFTVLLAIVLMTAVSPNHAVEADALIHAPAFDSARNVWINSEPLDWETLRGKVVLLNIWTYGCGNCKRSIPWLKSVYSRYGERGLQIVGVHSPEFAWEKPRQAVAAAVEHHGIAWPVMLDNGLGYWTALGNRYWPAFYIVDKQGRVAGYFFGETHAFDGRARTMERLIEKLLVD
ncbi:MAG: redoxin family protein [Gammaproteobacteria bacterium]|nr:redoxin family protein [Gammaproteobacteria bacterium]